jgi:carbon dioxide concentrating mechanism protein CcmN
MQLPTLPLISNSHVYVEGDVSIDPSAAIAAGVILRAAFDSKIIIAAGVCIGMGSILHSHQGTLEVEAGANLGAGVLVVGKGKIGANACIGAATTIWNSSIQSGQVVQAGSVVGDRGRQITDVSSTSTSTTSSDAPDPSVVSTNTTSKESLNGQLAPTSAVESSSTANEDSPTEAKVEEPNLETGTSVYGQGNLNRLLKTLFPYTTPSLNPPPEDG